MVTTPTAKPKPKAAQNRKVLIILGVAALVVLAYLFMKPKSSPANELPQTDSSGNTIPQAGGGADSSGQASADLLSALAGENQQLMKSFLASNSGLVSLAGSSFGSFAPTTTAGEPTGGGSFAGSTTSPSFDTSTYVAPSYQGPSGETVTPVTYASLGVEPSAITSSLVEPPLPQAPQVQGPVGSFAQTDVSTSLVPASYEDALAAAASTTKTKAQIAADTEAGFSSMPGGSVDLSDPGSSGVYGNVVFPEQTAPSVTITQSKPGSGNLAE